VRFPVKSGVSPMFSLFVDIGSPFLRVQKADQFIFEWRARLVVTERLGISVIDDVQSQDWGVFRLH
jgi:hypothetical protein